MIKWGVQLRSVINKSMGALLRKPRLDAKNVNIERREMTWQKSPEGKGEDRAANCA